MTGWQGELSVGVGVATYVGPGGSADKHRHHAIQIAASIGDSVDDSVEVTLDNDSILRARSVLIRSGVDHSFSASGPVALVLVEPNSEWGARLNTCIGDGLQAAVLDDETPLPSKLANPLVDLTSWIGSLGSLTSVSPEAHPRKQLHVGDEVRRQVRAILPSVPRLPQVSSLLGYSPDHLRRMVKRDLGMSFREVVLWERLQTGIEAAAEGGTITDAAVTAGFADGAHFARTFRRMFGLTPSDVLGNVQASQTGI